MRIHVLLGTLALGVIYAACGSTDERASGSSDGGEAAEAGDGGSSGSVGASANGGSLPGAGAGEGGGGQLTSGGDPSSIGGVPNDAGAAGGTAEAGATGQAGASGETSTLGCKGGTRAGFVDLAQFPRVAACAGAWEGDVENAAALCGAGWHVCLGSETDFKSVTFAQATAFEGCFAFDAAQDGYTCFSDCSSNIGTVDTAENIDMGGVGNGCAYKFDGAGSCITGGRVDASENNGIGCNYSNTFAGVACCAD